MCARARVVTRHADAKYLAKVVNIYIKNAREEEKTSNLSIVLCNFIALRATNVANDGNTMNTQELEKEFTQMILNTNAGTIVQVRADSKKIVVFSIFTDVK